MKNTKANLMYSHAKLPLNEKNKILLKEPSAQCIVLFFLPPELILLILLKLSHMESCLLYCVVLWRSLVSYISLCESSGLPGVIFTIAAVTCSPAKL